MAPSANNDISTASLPPPPSTPPIALRPPTVAPASPPRSFTPPPTAWLSGTWHVTHSTLPMWKSKRNVRITYAPLPSSAASTTASSAPAEAATDRLDDLVTYQTLTSSKLKTVHGLDKAAGAGAWDWRGRGWLVVAGSRWEVLGWGDEAARRQWVVTYFASTLFTPSGLDFYSRDERGLLPWTVAGIKEALAASEDEGVRKLAGEVFEVRMDGARTD
ncbi:hypothetical protein BJ546DRAFT_903094 [Cryomyces antarcticus]